MVTSLKTRGDVHAVALFILWCAANSLYATDAHKLLHNTKLQHLYVELTVVQILVSIALAFPLLRRPLSTITTVTPLALSISGCHCLGALLTNSSYGLLGATATLVWKLSEPFFTLIFKVTLQKQTVSVERITGVVFVVTGVLIFSGFNSRTPLISSPIVLANIVFPLRNVLLKQRQRYTNQDDAVGAFLKMQIHALPFAFIALLVKRYLYSSFPPQLLPSLVRNALFFGIYQMSSIALLARLDSLTHAIANVLKRFSSIFVAAVFIHTNWQFRHIVGLSLTTVGFPLYALGDTPDLGKKLQRRLVPHYSHLLFLAVPSIILFAEPTNFLTASSSTIPLLEPLSKPLPVSVKEDVQPLIVSEPTKVDRLPSWVTSPRKLFKNDGVVRDLSILRSVEVPVGKDPVFITQGYEQDAMRSDNYGNNIWKWAAHHVLPNFSGASMCKTTSDRAKCTRIYPTLCNDTAEACFPNQSSKELQKSTHMVMYYPTANAFDVINKQEFGRPVNWMRRYGDVALIIGAGNQAYFGGDMLSCKLNPGGTILTTAEKFEFTENAKRLFAEHERRKLPVLFRGDFTWRAAKTNGYNYGISLGCPSLMLNPNPDAGSVLATKYAALRNRIGDRSLRVAINVKNECEGFSTVFVQMMKDYPSAVLFAQHAKEAKDAVTTFGISQERVRGLLNVTEWQDAIRDFDVSIGVRIHGNMLALSADVPVLVIATDHRVLELVDRMFVPHTTNMDKRIVPGLDVAELVSSFNFDPDAFDQNRCETANTYDKLFRRYQIPISKQIKRIGARCA